MKWSCKFCSTVVSTKADLLKHYRLQHDCLGRHRALPCIFPDCPCSFKTLNSIRSHLKRHHAPCDVQTPEENFCFLCQHCASITFSTEAEFFTHLRHHLKKQETVDCVFNQCDFKTNVYGTFAAHKSRKHMPHCVDDFKPQVLHSRLDSAFGRSSSITHEEESEEESILPLRAVSEILPDLIEKKIGSVLLKLESLFHVSGKCIDQLVEDLHFISTEGSAEAFRCVLEQALKKHDCVLETSVIRDLVKELCESSPLCKSFGLDGPFRSSYKRKEYYKENFLIVEPVEYVTDAMEKLSFQYVPILKVLSHLMNDTDISQMALERPQISKQDVPTYRSFHDGLYFQQNTFLSEGEVKISLILYIDEFEICNPLGTSRKKHKITAVYWVLGNVPSVLRSELSSIYLAVLCKTEDVKRHGYSVVLEPLLKDLGVLEREGIFISSLGKNIRGTVMCVVADNLAAHSLGGFVENFSGPYPCRFCLGQRSDYQLKEVRLGAFQRRTNEQHTLHIQTALEDTSVTHSFGVKRQCIMTDKLEHFHVLSGYPPDLLHDVFEGIVPVELALCLDHFIKKKYLTVSEINAAIQHFPFKWSDKTNCPKSVPLSFANRKSIGGNAHENWALLRFLPFLIGPKIPVDEPAWLILMDLKEIVELIVSPVHSHESIGYLDSKISEHRHRFLSVFPQQKLLPKHHFLEHYPELIQAFGPLVAMWTMRFEAKHSFFKRVVQHTHSFRNILLSLAVKHQLLMAFHFHYSENFKPSLSVSHVSNVSLDLLHNDVQEAVRKKFPNEKSVVLANTVSCYGTKYCKGMVLAHGSTAGLPDFVQIHQLMVVNNSLGFIVKTRTAWYNEHLRSFELDAPGHVKVLLQEDLSDVVPLAAYTIKGKCMDMCEPAVLRVIVDQNSIRKLHLPSGIPDTCDKLESVVREKFQIKGSFTLHYKDTDFDEFFSLISTSELKDKDTIKVVQTEPVIINLTTIDSLECAGPSATDAQVPSDDCSLASSAPSAFGSSDDTVLLSFPDSHGQRSKPWPSPFEIPEFAYDTELVLKSANDAYKNDGTALNNPSVKSDILEKLAEKIFQFCAYPTSQQISSVAEALIQKHPCLKEPGSFSGFYGWQTRLKYKMGNYRSKLRSLGCPEVAVNSAKNKRPAAVKKPKKAEINYLPPHPSGVTIQSLEQERVELLDEVKIRDNWRNINQKMARTFSYRRQEIIEKSPSIASILERWPALFDTSQVKEEFRRLTAVELETTFMGNLDKHTDALLSLFCTKGGHAGQQISEILNMLNQTSPVEQRREVVIRCLIVYLSENPENLIKHHQDTHGNKEELEPLTLKIITKGGSTDDPLQTGIVLEGIEVMTGLAGVAKACVYLLGLIYAINLSYPKELRYSFEFFQKILLELDSGKLSPKVYSLKNKLLC